MLEQQPKNGNKVKIKVRKPKPKGQLHCRVDLLPERILAIVYKNFDYLKRHPVQMAWAMMCYELTHLACRRSGFDTDNPKDPLLYDEWPGLSQDDRDLWYASWGISVTNTGYPEDNLDENRPHTDMTIHEWIDYKTNPNYRYNDQYGSDHLKVLDDIFFVCGNGMKWNKNGFVFNDCCNTGIDECIFYGYTQAEKDVPPDIRNAIKKVTGDPRIKKHCRKLIKDAAWWNTLTNKQRQKIEYEMFLKQDSVLVSISNVIETLSSAKPIKIKAEETPKKPCFYPFWKNSIFGTIPDNAHFSYVNEAVYLARMIINGEAVTTGNMSNDKSFNKEQIEIAQAVLDKWAPQGAKR